MCECGSTRKMLKFLGVICVFTSYVVADKKLALSKIEKEYGKMMQECMAEFPFTPEDIDALNNNRTTDNVGCMFGCTLKKIGMMDDDGNMSAEGVRKSTQKVFSDDPDMIEKGEMFIEACKSVNEIPVSDGKKGCERAGLIIKCSMEKASDFELF